MSIDKWKASFLYDAQNFKELQLPNKITSCSVGCLFGIPDLKFLY
jgi:hypothetical protein